MLHKFLRDTLSYNMPSFKQMQQCLIPKMHFRNDNV